MIAYHNDPELKAQILNEIRAHREADRIIRGTYGRGEGTEWKGCAVGCSIHSLNERNGTHYNLSDHSAYEMGFGIPRALGLPGGLFV